MFYILEFKLRLGNAMSSQHFGVYVERKEAGKKLENKPVQSPKVSGRSEEGKNQEMNTKSEAKTFKKLQLA